jgi:hypothetical protein
MEFSQNMLFGLLSKCSKIIAPATRNETDNNIINAIIIIIFSLALQNRFS